MKASMATAASETEHMPELLAGARSGDVETAPYAHLIRKAVLAPELYQSLNNSFPSLQAMLGSRDHYGNNEAIRMTAHQVLTEKRVSRLWQDFFAFHSSQEFWRQIVGLFGPHFRQRFPGLEERVGRRYEDWRVIPRGFAGDADIRLDCQFVMNTPVTQVSSVKTAHIDLCDKIFSALFYFRDAGDTTSGGDFEIYDWRRSPRFIKHRTLERDVEKVETVPYAPNSYACFVNSEQSVHGVSPRGITQVPRRYINFIAELPVKAFQPKQLNRWQKFWYRDEVRAASQDERY